MHLIVFVEELLNFKVRHQKGLFLHGLRTNCTGRSHHSNLLLVVDSSSLSDRTQWYVTHVQALRYTTGSICVVSRCPIALFLQYWTGQFLANFSYWLKCMRCTGRVLPVPVYCGAVELSNTSCTENFKAYFTSYFFGYLPVE